MPRPHVRDRAAILDALRRDGAVYWPISELPADYEAWRRDLRRAARAKDLRISVRRVKWHFWVEHVDHEVTDDERDAAADVMGALLQGGQLSFEDAVKARARRRLLLIRGDVQDGPEQRD
jgi:hypothetical protein